MSSALISRTVTCAGYFVVTVFDSAALPARLTREGETVEVIEQQFLDCEEYARARDKSKKKHLYRNRVAA